MRFYSQDSGRNVGFARWLDAHLPSCNDNDKPDNDSTVIALNNPARDRTAGGSAARAAVFALAVSPLRAGAFGGIALGE